MRKKIFIGIILGTIGVAFFSLGLSATAKKDKDDLYRQVSLFSDTLAIVQSDYVEETKAQDLIYGALKGMLSSLDPHSQFMDPQEYNELKIDTEGKFGGLGIEITIKDGLLTIVTPIEDTPAWKAGLKSGDKIVKINDKLTREMTLSDAVKIMRGKPGEVVNLTVLRESEKKLLEFKIVRDIIKIKDIKEARILDDGIGYIRLVEFRESTPKDFSAALDKLKKEGMNALILDLRNNPGGLLDVAVKVTGEFLENGKPILTTRSRKNTQDLEFVSRAGSPITDIPMVVLINEGSASGSEILAGALQDYKRAIIVGIKSFGKGSVQTVIPLGDGSALRLTTSKYLTPLGREIHGKGVIPDIEVEDSKVEPAQKEKDAFDKSEDLLRELENKDKKSPADDKGFDYKSDNQIARAVDILKALKFYNK